jgi:hypothetical protein
MHDDGDWDSELGDALGDIALFSGGWFSVVCALVGLALLLWHLLGE